MQGLVHDVQLVQGLHWLVHGVQWLVHGVHWLVHGVQWLVHGVQWLVHGVQWLVRGVHWLVQDVHWLVHDVQWLVHMNCVLIYTTHAEGKKALKARSCILQIGLYHRMLCNCLCLLCSFCAVAVLILWDECSCGMLYGCCFA